MWFSVRTTLLLVVHLFLGVDTGERFTIWQNSILVVWISMDIQLTQIISESPSCYL